MYFAKYLPVEGEIKPMDWYFNKDGELNLYQGCLPAYHYIDAKKAQLFLCSRDIQGGDEVLCLKTAWMGNEVELRTKGKTYKVCNIDIPEMNYKSWGYINNQGQEQYIHHPEEMVKVIGPISPQALWVKEGDEFEGEGVDFVPCILDTYEDPTQEEIFYMIKCQNCKTFH